MGFRPRIPYITVLNRLGLTNGLKLCLDAGDSASYTSGQKWLDRSGNGYDFFLGTTSGVDASDPVFTGSAGNLSDQEYWACDTDAVFTYDAANETWMDNIHKDGAVFTILAWVYLTSYGAGSSAMICGTVGNSTNQIGFQYGIAATSGQQRIQVYRGDTTTVLQVASGGSAIGLNGWHLCALTLSENGGASAAQYVLDGVADGAAFNPAYTNPSASAASFVMQVAGDGNNVRPLGINGAARIAMVSIWEGVALSVAQIKSIYDATHSLLWNPRPMQSLLVR